jgi:23S rRNA (guanosine2251-2'-O)-methyltransferase
MSDDIIYGVNPVMEALRGSRRAFELFVTDGADRRLEKLLSLAAERGVPVRRRDRMSLTRLAGTEHHQGVLLRVEPFPYADLFDLLDRWKASGEPGLILVLDGVQDPHNLGALIRSAACAGVHGVIIPQDRACGVTPTVEKVSAGGAEAVPVARVTNIAQTLAVLKREGFWVYGAAGEAAESLYGQDFTGHTAIVIGGEGEGVRPLVGKQCDLLISIPLSGRIGSLNASVAGGIMLFEAVRQRISRSATLDRQGG